VLFPPSGCTRKHMDLQLMAGQFAHLWSVLSGMLDESKAHSEEDRPMIAALQCLAYLFALCAQDDVVVSMDDSTAARLIAALARVTTRLFDAVSGHEMLLSERKHKLRLISFSWPNSS
jgi:hypothetical protein